MLCDMERIYYLTLLNERRRTVERKIHRPLARSRGIILIKIEKNIPAIAESIFIRTGTNTEKDK